MKALVRTQYGGPEVLSVQEVKQPSPKGDEVLIKMKATSLNSWDWDWLTGKPRIYRLLAGFPKPHTLVLGADVAGVVEAVGSKASRFKPGDEVFGDLSSGRWGGLAEYTCTSEKFLVHKPSSMTFEQAAALPQAGGMALQSLTEKRAIQPGDSVLMNGAGGGVGTFVIQIATALGAEVTAVDLPEKHSLLLSLGARHVIDYTREDFTKQDQLYDLIVDVISTRSVFEYKRTLRPGGVYAMIGGKVGRILQQALLGWVVSTREKKLTILAHEPNKYLSGLINLFEAGQIKPVIDTVYSLEEAPEAFRRLGAGQVKGKVVIAIDK